MKPIITTIVVNIEKYVIQEIRRARKSIYIAMAWLTAKKVQQALLDKKNSQPSVVIEIVVDPNAVNQQYFYNKVSALRAAGVVVHDKASRKFLHVKMMIIDAVTVLEGSYNFTENAKNNLEKVILTKSKAYADYQLRIFQTYTDKHYIDGSIALLLRNLPFAQGLVSAYFPFSKAQFSVYQNKIAPGECLTVPNGLFDEMRYKPGFIFNPVCKAAEKNGFSEFPIPITKQWLKVWHNDRNRDLLYESYRDSFGKEYDFWKAFVKDLNRNEKALEQYFKEKLTHIYSIPVLQQKIEEQVDVIMEDSLWDLNFSPFMTDHAFTALIEAFPNVVIESRWPLERVVLQRK
jgi:hypothetical protein